MVNFVVPFTIFSFLLLVNAVRGADVYQNLTLFAKIIAPDGFLRSASVTNGQFPGPLIRANKGDTVKITVNNELWDPTMERSTSIVRLLPTIVYYIDITSLALARPRTFTLQSLTFSLFLIAYCEGATSKCIVRDTWIIHLNLELNFAFM